MKSVFLNLPSSHTTEQQLSNAHESFSFSFNPNKYYLQHYFQYNKMDKNY